MASYTAALRPRVRGRRGRRVLHGRVRRHPVGRAGRLLRPGRLERSVRARALHGPGGDGHRSRRDQARSTPVRQRLPLAAGIIVLAVLGHAVWNAPVLAFLPSPPVHGAEWLLVPVDLAIKGLPLFCSSWSRSGSHARERRWLDGALSSEVGLGGVTAEEFAVLRVPARRRAAVRAMRRRAGAPAARLLARLQREQVDLAMVSSRVTTIDAPERVAQRAYCMSLRAALEAIPGAAAAAQPAGYLQAYLARAPSAAQPHWAPPEGTLLPESMRTELARQLARLRVVRDQVKEIEQERSKRLAALSQEGGSACHGSSARACHRRRHRNVRYAGERDPVTQLA